MLFRSWGEAATLDYVARLSETVDPIIIRGGTAGMTEVLSGGALMTSSGRADSNAELQAAGAPIEMHYMDLVPLRVLYNGLVKDADHPNAAACFAGWLASDEGKNSFESVEFKANDFPPAGVPDGADFVFVDSAQDAEVANAAGKKIQEIIAPDFGKASATTEEPEVAGLAAVCAAGAEEGTFTYWATIEPDNFSRIIEPFEASYPGIDIEFLSIREEDGAGQILTSIAAGADIEPDMLYGSQDGLFPIISRDLIDTDYDWTQVGVSPDMVHEIGRASCRERV